MQWLRSMKSAPSAHSFGCLEVIQALLPLAGFRRSGDLAFDAQNAAIRAFSAYGRQPDF